MAEENSREDFFGQSLPDRVYDSAFPEDSSAIKAEAPDAWEEKEILDIFPELRVLDEISQKKSLERLGRAREKYNASVLLLGRAKSEAEEARAAAELQSFQWEWQKKEHEARQKAEENRLLGRARQEALHLLTSAMQEIDLVKNPAQKASAALLDLKSGVYRKYIQLQFASRNLKPAIPVLEAYLSLSPEHAAESEPHRLLAAAFRVQEINARRMRNRKEELVYKQRKHTHLLKYAELAYGTSSSQYAALSAQAARDLTEVLP
ncbi:MAG: hypothetical protein HS115_08205 [Spirochaetales bacterium]|nr:hypothetical protein [Spirochaetales bacterium]